MIKLINQINTWNLKKKISFFLSLTIMTTSIIILVASTTWAGYYMTKKSENMVKEQLETLASNYDDTLAQYQNIALSIVMSDQVQQYCKNIDNFGTEYEKVLGGTYSYLSNMSNVQKNMNFVVVLKENKDSYVYKGNSSAIDSKFETVYKEDYEESTPIKEGSSMRISFGNNYFRDGQYTLTMYQPIYSTTYVMEKKGMLIMNLSDNMLEQINTKNSERINSELILVNQNGKIVSVSNREKTGNQLSYQDRIRGINGDFQVGGLLINYQKVGNWNYYLVNEMPILELYRGSIGIIAVLLIIILLITVVSLIILQKMMNSFYEPINRVVTIMDDVADGRLEVRIDMQSMDTDSRKLAEGFNIMMDKIDLLMEQMKIEHKQMEQIRFNALYSQIKPHFLYNTLECIHWQALVDGNDQVSTMVKAMAQYYRICLSKGKEVINLEEELKHINSYLIIQNMRYDDIIKLVDNISEEYYEVKIPKMTLQPLIENAIYHGIRIKEGKKGEVILNIKKEDESIYIYVEDSGTGMTKEKVDEMNELILAYDETFGYGIRNVNKRISLMFGVEYGLRFFQNVHGGISVEIHLPFK